MRVKSIELYTVLISSYSEPNFPEMSHHTLKLLIIRAFVITIVGSDERKEMLFNWSMNTKCSNVSSKYISQHSVLHLFCISVEEKALTIKALKQAMLKMCHKIQADDLAHPTT